MKISDVYMCGYQVDPNAIINIYTDDVEFTKREMPEISGTYNDISHHILQLSVKWFEIVNDNLINVLIYTL